MIRKQTNMKRYNTIQVPEISLESDNLPIARLRSKINSPFRNTKVNEINLQQVPIVKDNYDKIDGVYEEIHDTISALEAKILAIIKSEEKDFMESYEQMVKNVRKVIEEYKKRADSKECKYRNEAIINSLVKEIREHKENNMNLVRTCAELRADVTQLQSLNNSLTKEKEFYEKRLKEIKRENKGLRMALNKVTTLEAKLNVPVKKNTYHKPPELANKSIDFAQELLEIAKLEKEEGMERGQELYKRFFQRSEEVIAGLRQQLKAEKKNIQKLRALQTISQSAKNELEELFCECVEEEKKKIAKQKLEVRKDEAIQLKSHNKASIIEEFLTNKKLLQHIFVAVFKSTNKLNNGLLGGLHNLLHQNLSDNRFPQVEMPPIVVGLNDPPKGCRYHHKTSKSTYTKRSLHNSYIDLS